MLVHTPRYWVILAWVVMLGSCWSLYLHRGNHLPFIQCNRICWVQQSGEPKDLKSPIMRREAVVLLSQPLKTHKTVGEKNARHHLGVDCVFHM